MAAVDQWLIFVDVHFKESTRNFFLTLIQYIGRVYQCDLLHKTHNLFSRRYTPTIRVGYFLMGADGYWWRLG